MEGMYQEITDFLKKMVDTYPSISFRGEYDSSISTFIIEVQPLSEYKDNEEYGLQEVDFNLAFSNRHPYHDIIFVSDDSINKVRHPEPRLRLHLDFPLRHP